MRLPGPGAPAKASTRLLGKRPLGPDRLPALRRIERLASPLIVLHGNGDETVPCSHGRALRRPRPTKAMWAFPGLRHNDFVTLAGAV